MKYFKKGNFIIVKDASDQEKNSFNLNTIDLIAINDLEKKIKFGDGELSFSNFTSFTLEDGTVKLKADFPTFEALKTWALDNFFFVAKSNNGGTGGAVNSVNGKTGDVLLPTILTANNQTERLALTTARVGDLCWQKDKSVLYLLNATPPSSAANWQIAKTDVQNLDGLYSDGRNMYVNSSAVGSANNGSLLLPFKTINQAIPHLQDNMVLHISGVFEEDVIIENLYDITLSGGGGNSSEQTVITGLVAFNNCAFVKMENICCDNKQGATNQCYIFAAVSYYLFFDNILFNTKEEGSALQHAVILNPNVPNPPDATFSRCRFATELSGSAQIKLLNYEGEEAAPKLRTIDTINRGENINFIQNTNDSWEIFTDEKRLALPTPIIWSKRQIPYRSYNQDPYSNGEYKEIVNFYYKFPDSWDKKDFLNYEPFVEIRLLNSNNKRFKKNPKFKKGARMTSPSNPYGHPIPLNNRYSSGGSSWTQRTKIKLETGFVFCDKSNNYSFPENQNIGFYDAANNTPSLSSAFSQVGQYLVVQVAGFVLNILSNVEVGDMICCSEYNSSNGQYSYILQKNYKNEINTIKRFDFLPHDFFKESFIFPIQKQTWDNKNAYMNKRSVGSASSYIGQIRRDQQGHKLPQRSKTLVFGIRLGCIDPQNKNRYLFSEDSNYIRISPALCKMSNENDNYYYGWQTSNAF